MDGKDQTGEWSRWGVRASDSSCSAGPSGLNEARRCTCPWSSARCCWPAAQQVELRTNQKQFPSCSWRLRPPAGTWWWRRGPTRWLNVTWRGSGTRSGGLTLKDPWRQVEQVRGGRSWISWFSLETDCFQKSNSDWSCCSRSFILKS